ncbi:unnamed protein product, partial [Rotaria magnacalcarata]
TRSGGTGGRSRMISGGGVLTAGWCSCMTSGEGGGGWSGRFSI